MNIQLGKFGLMTQMGSNNHNSNIFLTCFCVRTGSNLLPHVLSFSHCCGPPVCFRIQQMLQHLPPPLPPPSSHPSILTLLPVAQSRRSREQRRGARINAVSLVIYVTSLLPTCKQLQLHCSLLSLLHCNKLTNLQHYRTFGTRCSQLYLTNQASPPT